MLRLIRRAGIRNLEENVYPLALLPDNPGTHEERKRQKIARLKTITAEWRRRADAAKFYDNRLHFTNLLPVAQRRLQHERREEDAWRTREPEREDRRISALQGNGDRGK